MDKTNKRLPFNGAPVYLINIQHIKRSWQCSFFTLKSEVQLNYLIFINFLQVDERAKFILVEKCVRLIDY